MDNHKKRGEKKGEKKFFSLLMFLFVLVLIIGCVSESHLSIKDAMAMEVGQEVTIRGTTTRFLMSNAKEYEAASPGFMNYIGTSDPRMFEGTIKDSTGEADIFISWEAAKIYGEKNAFGTGDTVTITGIVSKIKMFDQDYYFINVKNYKK